jgi:hypothetical protein
MCSGEKLLVPVYRTPERDSLVSKILTAVKPKRRAAGLEVRYNTTSSTPRHAINVRVSTLPHPVRQYGAVTGVRVHHKCDATVI